MKVILINGSPRLNGCTNEALSIIAQSLKEEGIETQIFHIGNESIHGCTGCGQCSKNGGKCIYEDNVNELIKLAEDADGFIFGSPVYYSSPNGSLISFMDRLFYAGGKNLAYKPAASICSARRAGTTATIEVLNKYFLINNMPIVASNYWSMVHGSSASDVRKDEEGVQIMENLAKNMAWMLKCIEIGRDNGINSPIPKPKIKTNFIR